MRVTVDPDGCAIKAHELREVTDEGAGERPMERVGDALARGKR
jgi:hypothetical protein